MCDKSNHDHKGKCQNEFETAIGDERKEIVYCKECYQAEFIYINWKQEISRIQSRCCW